MRKKIIFVCPYYPPFGAGGAERTSHLHAMALNEMGFDVSVITPNFGSRKYEKINDIEIYRFKVNKRLQIGEQVNARFFYNPLIQRKVLKTIKFNFDKDKILCIHSQHQFLLGGSAKASKKLNLPLIVHIRDTGLLCAFGGSCLIEKKLYMPNFESNIKHHIWCYFNNWSKTYLDRSSYKNVVGFFRSLIPLLILYKNKYHLKRSDKIVFASENLRELYLNSNKYCKKENCKVVYAIAEKIPKETSDQNKIEIEQLIKNNVPIILYVGKLSKGKGSDTLFSSHKIVLKEIPNAKLVICGNINKDWKYEEQHTIFLGFLNQNQINYIYSKCNVVVVPSSWPEPLGWGTIDAGRHKKPIVATKVGGIPEAVINNKTGFLVEKKDSIKMGNAIIKLLKNYKLSNQLGLAAYQHVFKKFGKDNVKKQLYDLYKEFKV